VRVAKDSRESRPSLDIRPAHKISQVRNMAKKKATKVIDREEELSRRGRELIRAADQLHRDKNISLDAIFAGIEKAIRLAVHKAHGDEEEVVVHIDRSSGLIEARRGSNQLDPEELGRIFAQAAKQMMIQNFREEESTAVFNEYQARKGDLVHGTIQRMEGGATLVSLGRSEALLPRGEQIPGDDLRVDTRVKAVILEVKKSGHRVKIILSRTHGDFVRRLFETEIPEIKDGTISIRAVAREAGYRTKVAVSSIDMKVDCVGACVGVRGSRIKNIVDELGGERIDIVRWNDSLHVLIPNALQPAKIEEVFLYARLGRAIVLVMEDQLSLAIGRRGQNVRLASKLVGWDIEIMTHDELNTGIERAENWFMQIPGVTAEMAEEVIAYAEEAAQRVEEETQTQLTDARGTRAQPDADSVRVGPTDTAAGEGRAGESAQAEFERLFDADGQQEGNRAALAPEQDQAALDEVVQSSAGVGEQLPDVPERGGEWGDANTPRVPVGPDTSVPEYAEEGVEDSSGQESPADQVRDEVSAELPESEEIDPTADVVVHSSIEQGPDRVGEQTAAAQTAEVNEEDTEPPPAEEESSEDEKAE
jgi:N utilization substance protein A